MHTLQGLQSVITLTFGPNLLKSIVKYLGECASCDESQEHLEPGSRSNFDEPPGPPIEALIATS